MVYLFLVPALQEKPSNFTAVGPPPPPGLYLILSLFQQHLEISLEFPSLAGLRALLRSWIKRQEQEVQGSSGGFFFLGDLSGSDS